LPEQAVLETSRSKASVHTAPRKNRDITTPFTLLLGLPEPIFIITSKSLPTKTLMGAYSNYPTIFLKVAQLFQQKMQYNYLK
jgi:hypothetical protein